MDRMMQNLQRRSRELKDVINELDDFNGVVLNDQTRAELKKSLKGIKTLVRVDENGVINLRQHKDGENVIVIYPANGKIMVMPDILWKIIFSIEEQIQEMKCYEREIENEMD